MADTKIESVQTISFKDVFEVISMWIGGITVVYSASNGEWLLLLVSALLVSVLILNMKD